MRVGDRGKILLGSGFNRSIAASASATARTFDYVASTRWRSPRSRRPARLGDGRGRPRRADRPGRIRRRRLDPGRGVHAGRDALHGRAVGPARVPGPRRGAPPLGERGRLGPGRAGGGAGRGVPPRRTGSDLRGRPRHTGADRRRGRVRTRVALRPYVRRRALGVYNADSADAIADCGIQGLAQRATGRLGCSGAAWTAAVLHRADRGVQPAIAELMARRRVPHGEAAESSPGAGGRAGPGPGGAPVMDATRNMGTAGPSAAEYDDAVGETRCRAATSTGTAGRVRGGLGSWPTNGGFVQ